MRSAILRILRDRTVSIECEPGFAGYRGHLRDIYFLGCMGFGMPHDAMERATAVIGAPPRRRMIRGKDTDRDEYYMYRLDEPGHVELVRYFRLHRKGLSLPGVRALYPNGFDDAVPATPTRTAVVLLHPTLRGRTVR